MTIQRDGREMQIECDSCPSTGDMFSSKDFRSMVETAKGDGWEIAPDSRAEGGYRHTCPDCRGGSNRLERAKDLLG